MSDEAQTNYVVTRHAAVAGDDDVCWVAVARWLHADGRTEWCLECWDDVGEADHDLTVPDEVAAVARANEEFGLTESDWHPGPQPWGRPNPGAP